MHPPDRQQPPPQWSGSSPPRTFQTVMDSPTGSPVHQHATSLGLSFTRADPGPPPSVAVTPPAEAAAIPFPNVLGRSSRPFACSACELILTVLSWLLVVVFFPLSMLACVRVVQEYERAIIFRLGRLAPSGAQGPGLFFILPCMDKFTCVDLRVVSFDVAPQEILTKDLVTVSVDAVVYFRIFEPIVSITNVENSGYSTRLLAATTLRTVLGQYSLADILSQRESIAHLMQATLDEATDAWGVKVERVEVKDVRLPLELQRAMAAEAEASREAKAKLIMAEGEKKASRALKDAADVMAESPSAMQLRYLQTLNNISAEKNSTIVFPVPIDLFGGLMKGLAGSGRSSGRGSPASSVTEAETGTAGASAPPTRTRSSFDPAGPFTSRL